MPSAPCSVQARAHRAHELARELRLVEAVELELAVSKRVEQLVDVVGSRLVAEISTSAVRKLRLGRAQHDGVEHARVR